MKMRWTGWALLVAALGVGYAVPADKDAVPPHEKSPTFWMESGYQDVMEALRVQQNNHIAKNLIIIVGDGMGIPTVMASRVFLGQKEGRPGEDAQLSFEKFPYVALSKTYSVSNQVPDSAATATALFTGVKTNSASLGVSARAEVGNCESVFGNEVSSILQWAQEAGKDTGLVTNTRVTHATPAALYAHSANRDWETDSKMHNVSTQCKDIAKQLVEDLPGRDLKVILGGGRIHFTPKEIRDPKTGKNGSREDNMDLIDYWKKEKANRSSRFKYVTNTEELGSVTRGTVDYLLGLFSFDHMHFEMDRDKSPKGEPSLSAMTKSAIQVLQKNNKGYFLMVEGGRIDHAHHNNNAKRALSETVQLAEAVQTALDMTSRKDTLILVTADHSHVMTVNGYPERGNPILGKVSDLNKDLDKDNLPYTTLMYTNGPSYHISKETGKRRNLTNVDTESGKFFQDVAVPLRDETHGGEDVAIYASGPMAHLIHGVVEQNYVAHAMAYASCIGRNKDHCRRIGERLPLTQPSGSPMARSAMTYFHVFVGAFMAYILQ